MGKYRKKPILIEAMQWKGFIVDSKENLDYMIELEEWAASRNKTGMALTYKGDNVLIPTLEGIMTCGPGDWIICGVNSELYPCKDDIFRKTYEEQIE